MLGVAIEPEKRGDEQRLADTLHKLVDEDPCVRVEHHASLNETVLYGMGELHVRLLLERMTERFGVHVKTHPPSIPYRETVTKSAEALYRHKKQTGGAGQFGEVKLRVEPLARGSGFEFVDEIVGGSSPRNLIPAVEKGVQEALLRGPLAGYPVVDVRVRCIDGKHHPVDSNEMSFKLAGSYGFKAAVEQARPTLLEPIMDVEVSAPDQHVGDVMGDISQRRGRVQSTEARGTSQTVRAKVPMAEMLEYASTLTSMTGAKGSFHMSFSHYDEVPAQFRDRVVAEAKARQAEPQ